MNHLRRFCLAGFLTTAVIALPALAEIEFEIVSVDNTAVLSGYETSDLQVTTDFDWTAGALLLELTSGSIYQHAYGGDTPSSPALYPYFPAVEFDTSVGVYGSSIAGAAGDVGGDTLAFSTSELDVSFFNIDDSDTGTFSVGRITLTDDAGGNWYLGLTEDVWGQAMYQYSGTISDGVLELLSSSQFNGMTQTEVWNYNRTQFLKALGVKFDDQGNRLPQKWTSTSGITDTPDTPLDPLPEPTTLALLGLGMGFCVRRRIA